MGQLSQDWLEALSFPVAYTKVQGWARYEVGTWDAVGSRDKGSFTANTSSPSQEHCCIGDPCPSQMHHGLSALSAFAHVIHLLKCLSPAFPSAYSPDLSFSAFISAPTMLLAV